jgi:hypothetical protein
MPAAKYIVELTADEREQLRAIIRRGNNATRKITRARILLKAEERLTDDQIAGELAIGSATVGRVRQRFVEQGADRTLGELPRAPKRRKLSVKQKRIPSPWPAVKLPRAVRDGRCDHQPIKRSSWVLPMHSRTKRFVGC